MGQAAGRRKGAIDEGKNDLCGLVQILQSSARARFQSIVYLRAPFWRSRPEPVRAARDRRSAVPRFRRKPDFFKGNRAKPGAVDVEQRFRSAPKPDLGRDRRPKLLGSVRSLYEARIVLGKFAGSKLARRAP